MSLTDKIAEKIAGAFGWLILKELRRVATAIEHGVDSYREIHGFRPLFQSPAALATQIITEEQQDAQDGREAEIDAIAAAQEATGGDYLRQEILELLAGEQNVAITPETDLVALGKERGWLDEAGNVVMLPTGFGE